MKIFITGASGFIGFAVAGACACAGHDVFGLVRSAEKAQKLARHEIEPVLGTLDDPSTFRDRAQECEVLVHCAAEYSARYMQLDAQAIETLIASATDARLPRLVIYTSGVWVYGDTHGAKVDEASALNPPPIAATRAEHERKVIGASRGPLRTLVIRPGCVYGKSGSLTAAWFESATKDGAARIVGEGGNRWSMVHLDDLADLYLRAAESQLSAQIFNATDRSRFTVLSCARAASRATGAGGKVESVPVAQAAKAMGPMAECLVFDQHVDSSKAVRWLGWQPRHGGFADGAARYFAAWKASQAK